MKHLVISLTYVIAATFCDAAAVVKVVLGSASAKANTALAPGSSFSTGKKSRSELALRNGTLRTGSDTQVGIAGDDAISLQKGLALVAAKPRLFRGSVQVSTHEHEMKVRGTAQVYYDPGRSIRVVVLEGSVTIALGSLRGESVTLKRGQQLIMSPADRHLPTPIEIDLNRLMSTMALLDRAQFTPLATAERTADCARVQQEELVGGDELDSTGLVMGGAAPEIELLSEEIVHDEAQEDIPDLDGDGEADPEITLDEDGNPVEADTAADGESADGADTTDAGDGGDDGLAAKRRPGAGKSRTKTGVRTQSITINGQRVEAPRVNLGSATARVRVQISNSSQVAALADALRVFGKGGSILVDSSTLRSPSQILLDTSATDSGLISLRNATLNADVIKARAFSTGGDALVIDGSVLNGTQLIQLYAEGASTLRFRNHVTLNTDRAIIAGKTVQVDAGGSVNIRGKGDIFTDNAHFNQTGYGSINAGGGLSVNPHGSRPGW